MKQDIIIKNLYKKAKIESSKNDNLSSYKSLILNAYRIRLIELKFLELFSEAKISGTVHTCVGQEFTGVAISEYLKSYDWVTSNHRCHGHFIAKTGNWQGLIDELLGLDSGVSSGIGSSQHLFQEGFISNGTQGSLLPVATGIGVSNKRRKRKGIVVSFIGEGTLGEGVVYETFNLASLFSSPHLIICENNYYSQTTAQAFNTSGSISARANAFGIKSFECSTWCLEALLAKCNEAISYIRDEKKPAFLKIDTYRLLAHSKGDDDRKREEVLKFEEIDLLNQLEQSSEYKFEFEKIKKEIDAYVALKLISPKRINYSSFSTDELPRKVNMRSLSILNEKTSMVKALSRAYKNQLIENDAIFIGEDIADPYGGAFKITKGFQEHNSSNVYSTPISEAGLVGMAIGMNLVGEKTFAEIMFGDFIVNAMDQIINNASKFHHMYGKKFSCDVVVRMPMGGRRGYGPTHSQSLEKFLLGIDNTLVASVTSLIDPTLLIESLAQLSCPKIIIENKTDYSSFLYQPLEDLYLEKIGDNLGTVKLSPKGEKPSLIVISYGYMARMIADNYIKIFQETDLVFTLMCPQLLHPVPINHLAREVKKCRNILLIEETTQGYGWCDGVAAELAEGISDINIKRLSSDPVAIPSNREVEIKNLVSLESIIKKIKEFRNTL